MEKSTNGGQSVKFQLHQKYQVQSCDNDSSLTDVRTENVRSLFDCSKRWVIQAWDEARRPILQWMNASQKKGLTGRKEQLAMFLKVQHPTLIQKVAKNCYNGRYQHNLHFGAFVCELYRVWTSVLCSLLFPEDVLQIYWKYKCLTPHWLGWVRLG